ncbi:hypothetical protein DPMN_145294 [Dreissena polymorpha]|uniref:Uncharacterized protein n=1 Tax=Dreissena polymorpha TaxID=45954 RepID=A0A9D4F5R2_DREPO|nr:hypothetical protein DPMN_145294 [Dreissena polymorpha]
MAKRLSSNPLPKLSNRNTSDFQPHANQHLSSIEAKLELMTPDWFSTQNVATSLTEM